MNTPTDQQLFDLLVIANRMFDADGGDGHRRLAFDCAMARRGDAAALARVAPVVAEMGL